jgi:hypothetical protein
MAGSFSAGSCGKQAGNGDETATNARRDPTAAQQHLR